MMSTGGKKRRGFTIIELIVVISVIGILAAIVTVSYSASQRKAKRASLESNAMQVKVVLGEYFTDNRTYPVDKAAVKTYLQSAGHKALATEFDTGTKYSYTASPASCTTSCTSYTIVVDKSNWQGADSEANIEVSP